MAPEYPPRLVVWTLNCEKDGLQGPIEYYEAPAEQVLRVRWAASECPDGFFEVGNGVAYVEDAKDVIVVPGSPNLRPTALEGAGYRHREGLKPGESWQMLILVLPKGYSVHEPRPPLADAKEFNGRLALWWMLERYVGNASIVQWELEEFKGDLASEAKRLNERYAHGYPAGDGGVVVEDVPYNHNTIRQLLLQSFTPEELNRLIRDSSNSELRSLRYEYNPNNSPADVVDNIIGVCERRLLVPDLLAEVRRANPRQYERFEPHLRV